MVETFDNCLPHLKKSIWRVLHVFPLSYMMHVEIHACACFHFADLKTLWLHEQLLHELLDNRV